MSEFKARHSLERLGDALDRLDEALAAPETDGLTLDATIQRFEFVIELYWKTLKRLLELEGVSTTTPREALQGAFQAQWIDDETVWLQMLRDRNESSHIYDEAAARRIYEHIRNYAPRLRQTHRFLTERLARQSG